MDGTYDLTEKDSENFEKYMIALEVGIILRKAAKFIHQEVTISCQGEKIHIVTKSTVRSSDEVFQIGVERPLTTLDGRKVQATVTKTEDGRGLHMVETWKKGKKTGTVTMTFDGDRMVLDLDCEGVKCRRVFTKKTGR